MQLTRLMTGFNQRLDSIERPSTSRASSGPEVDLPGGPGQALHKRRRNRLGDALQFGRSPHNDPSLDTHEVPESYQDFLANMAVQGGFQELILAEIPEVSVASTLLGKKPQPNIITADFTVESSAFFEEAMRIPRPNG